MKGQKLIQFFLTLQLKLLKTIQFCRDLPKKVNMGCNFNRLDRNREILVAMARINILPWKFSGQGQAVDSGAVSNLRRKVWIATLAGSALYALYIDMSLLVTVLDGVQNIRRYDQFGMHILRAFISTTFSYWAYKLFVKHPEEHRMLYSFTQTNPGE